MICDKQTNKQTVYLFRSMGGRSPLM